MLLTRDAAQICSAYTERVLERRHQLPDWFPIDYARDAFAATYPDSSHRPGHGRTGS